MSPSSTARGGVPRARFLPGEAVFHPELGRGVVQRDDEDGIEVTFERGAVSRLVQTPDGLRRIDPAQAGRIFPSWLEIDAPLRFEPSLTKGERAILGYLDSRLPEGWEIFVRPHLDGDLPSVAMLHPRAGAVLLDVVEVSDPAHPALVARGRDAGAILPVMRLERVRKRIYGAHVPSLAENINHDRQRYGVIRLALYFPGLAERTAATVMADHPHVLWLAGGAPLPADAARLAPFIPREARLTQAQHRALRAAFLHHYGNPDFLQSVVLRGKQTQLAKPTPGRRQLITGVAGSGKTLVLAYRAASIASTGKSVLILTYNRTLANYVRGVLGTVPIRFRSDRITVLHFHGLCQKLIGDAQRLALAEAASSEVDEGIDEEVISELSQDPDDMAPSQDWFDEAWPNAALAAIEIAVAPSMQFDAILIDEAQDISARFLQVLLRLLKGDGAELVAVIDRAQTIYERPSAFADPLVAKEFGRPSELSVGYRLSPQAATAANRFIDRWGLDTQPIEVPDQGLGLTDSLVAWHSVGSDAASGHVALHVIREWLREGKAPRDIALLVPSRDFGVAAVQLLAEHGISSNHVFPVAGSGAPMDGLDAIDGGSSVTSIEFAQSMKMAFTFADARMKVSTIQSYKGWECRHLVAVLPDVADPLPTDIARVYVALTRTRGDVVFIGKEDSLGLETIMPNRLDVRTDTEVERRFADLHAAAMRMPRRRQRAPRNRACRSNSSFATTEGPVADWSFLGQALPVQGQRLVPDVARSDPPLQNMGAIPDRELDRDAAGLGSAIVDVLQAVGAPQSLGLITHILRGSDGPATRALIALHHPPHVGMLGEYKFPTAAGMVEGAALSHPGLVLNVVLLEDDAPGPRKVVDLSDTKGADK